VKDGMNVLNHGMYVSNWRSILQNELRLIEQKEECKSHSKNSLHNIFTIKQISFNQDVSNKQSLCKNVITVNINMYSGYVW